MIYIKLDDSMNLVITVNEPIYRGDNLNQKIIYLIPLQVGEIDMLTATPYLSYIRADGVADITETENQPYKQIAKNVNSVKVAIITCICTLLVSGIIGAIIAFGK